MVRLRHLQTRFVLAGSVLLLATVAGSAWSALTFARLGAAVDASVRDSQGVSDLSTELAGALEREDDALLLALSGDTEHARQELAAERQRGDDCYQRLQAKSPAGAKTLAALRRDIDAYRAAGSELLASAGRVGARERYHAAVNPRLRRAVAACGAIREENFRAMEQAGVRARDEARRATWVVGGVSAAALVAAAGVAVWLARSVVVPVRQLTESVEAVRQGDFNRRLTPASADELGRLADGFNRMAEALAEYRQSSLGELISAKTTLEATLNALPDAVLVLDPDGQVAASNPPASAVLEALGGPGVGLRHLDLPAEHRAAIAEALAGRAVVPARTDFGKALAVPLGGRQRRFLLTALPVPGPDPRKGGAVVVLDDVTDFARLDELRSELIGIASHELKTPLTTLRMNLMLLGERSADLGPARQEMLAAALQGCEELGETIDELLDVTRIEAGQLRLNLGAVDLAGVLEQALRGLRPRFEDAGVRFDVSREPSPGPVRGDAARLRVVFANLLTNALKYSPPGGTVTVRTVAVAGEDGKPAVEVTVTDTGPGVPPEFRERVFEKFFRVEHHTVPGRDKVRGTGIGLYLCREIAKAHGGSIRCCEAPGGRGASFTLRLAAGFGGLGSEATG